MSKLSWLDYHKHRLLYLEGLHRGGLQTVQMTQRVREYCKDETKTLKERENAQEVTKTLFMLHNWPGSPVSTRWTDIPNLKPSLSAIVARRMYLEVVYNLIDLPDAVSDDERSVMETYHEFGKLLDTVQRRKSWTVHSFGNSAGFSVAG